MEESRVLYRGLLTEMPKPVHRLLDTAELAQAGCDACAPLALPAISPRDDGCLTASSSSSPPLPNPPKSTPSSLSQSLPSNTKKLQTKLNAALYRLHCRDAEVALLPEQLARAKGLAAKRFELSNRNDTLALVNRQLIRRFESLPAVVQDLSSVLCPMF